MTNLAFKKIDKDHKRYKSYGHAYQPHLLIKVHDLLSGAPGTMEISRPGLLVFKQDVTVADASHHTLGDNDIGKLVVLARCQKWD